LAGALRHDFAVRRNRAFAAFLTLLVAGCTSSGAADPSTGVPSSSTPPPVSSPTSSPTSSGFTGPPKPPTPTIPADVPRTGPNTKPGEKPPLMPLEATQHTSDGAKAFAEFFVKTIDWGYATISGTYIRHYSGSSCTTCATFADGLDKDRRAGEMYFGGRSTVVDAKPNDRSHPYSILVTADITSFEKKSSGGKFISGEEAHHNLPFVVSLAWGGTAWQVRGLAVRG
jgi:hypothetical protein